MKEIKKITVVYTDNTSEVLFEMHKIGSKRKFTTAQDRHAVLMFCFPGKDPEPLRYIDLLDKVKEAYLIIYSQPIGLTFTKEVITFFRDSNWTKNKPRGLYYLNL